MSLGKMEKKTSPEVRGANWVVWLMGQWLMLLFYLRVALTVAAGL
jgi:hypothetical protein